MATATSPPEESSATRPGRALRGARPRLPRLPRVRARAVAQHPERLPHRPAPVRRIPRRASDATRSRRAPPTSPSSSPSSRSGNGRPACSAATIHRKTACLRSFYKHLRREELVADDPTAALDRAAARQEAAPGPQLRRGQEAARAAARHRARGAARPRPARADVRLRAARVGDDRARGRRRRPRQRLRPRPRQGLEGARRPARPPGGRGDPALPARPGRPKLVGSACRAQAVRQLQRGGAADPPGPLQDRPRPRPQAPASRAR